MATYVNTVRYGLSVNTTVLSDCYVDQVWLADNSGGPSYLDETTDANSTTAGDVPLTGYTDSNDCIYIGDSETFSSIYINMSVAAAGASGRTLEYYNGSTWVECPTQVVSAGTIQLTGTTNVVFWYPAANWATVAVNSVTKYYVRLRVSGTVTTPGTISYIAIGRNHPEWTKTVYIPETTTRTFLAAFIRACNQMNQNESPYVCLYVKVGTGTRAGVSIASPGSSGYFYPMSSCGDFTSQFTSDFGSGTSASVYVMLCTVGPQAAARFSLGTNATGEIIVTYQAEAQDVRIKTVCIPIEAKITNTTTSLAEIGTNQWPALDTFCPEGSKTFRDVFLHLRHGWTYVSAGYLSYALDAEAAVNMGPGTATYATTVPVEYYWVRNDAATNAAHAIKVKHTGTNAYGLNVSGLLWVTYEYHEADTDTVLNSIRLPMLSDGCHYHESTQPGYARGTFIANEPATVTLVQSAVVWDIGAAGAILVYVGSQAARTYLAETAANPPRIVQRLDANGAQGSGLTLVRGQNTVVSYAYQTSSTVTAFSFQRCMAVINYTSGKSSVGTQAHNKTLWTKLSTTPETPSYGVTEYASVTVPLGSNYYIQGIDIKQIRNRQVYAEEYRILRIAGEGDGAGLGGPTRSNGLRTSPIPLNCGYWETPITAFVKRFPTDPTWGVVDVTAAHTWQIIGSVSTEFWASEVTFHSITETVTGTVSGYTGDGSGLTVHLFREDTDEYLGTATTAAGGGYTFTWYSDNMNLYATCRQSDALCGRSTDGKAS